MTLNRKGKFFLFIFLAIVVLYALVQALIYLEIIRIKSNGENVSFALSINGSDLRIKYLDANSKYIALKISDEIRATAPSIMIYDRINGLWSKIPGLVDYEIGGNFSRVNSNDFLFTIGEFIPETNFNSKIYRCDLKVNRCEFVFSYEDPAHSFVDFPDGRMLFVSGPPESGGPGMPYRYKKRDFFMRFPDGKISKLTDLELYSLGPINLTKYGLIIGAYGTRKQDYPVGKESEIYRLDFDNSNNQINVGSSLKTPFIIHEGPIVSGPSILPDSKYLSFFSRPWKNRENGFYRQSIVVRDLAAKKDIDVFTYVGSRVLSSPRMADDENLVFMISDDKKSNFYNRNFIAKLDADIFSLSKSNVKSIKYSEIHY